MSMAADSRTAARGKSHTRIYGWTVRVAGGALAVTVLTALALTIVGPKASTPGVAAKTSAPMANDFTFPRDGDGPVYVMATLNGHRIRFIVDKSVRATVLSPEDAQTARLADGDLKFTDRVDVGQRSMSAAPVTVREFSLNTLTLFDMKVEVAEQPMPDSIAGKSFLDRFSSYELLQDKLVLRQ
jgi:clan AA aspartic protease (TIGR02281 family)